MLPGPLAPLDAHKTRALTTIYAPRKVKPRKHRTAKSRMLENDIPTKPSLSPFHPLPAIGQNAKVLVFDLKPDSRSIKLQEVLQPLTPLNIHGYRKRDMERPQQLIRENTYDVIEPIYLSASKVKIKEPKPRKDGTISPKTRFKNAAMQVARITSNKETGKLLCLRERQTYSFQNEDESCRLQRLPQTPAEKLNKLSEIFQGLEMKGRHKDKLKKENSWF